MFLKHFLKFLWIDVSFEGSLKLSVLSLVDSAVDGKSLTGFDVALSGVEMGVSGNVVAFFYNSGEKHVLGCASLMSGDYMIKAGDACDCVLKLEE